MELDSQGRLQALWTLDGLRIPAEHVTDVYLGYLSGAKRYVLSVLAMDPDGYAVRWRAIQEGRSGIRPLWALRELSERAQGSGQAKATRADPYTLAQGMVKCPTWYGSYATTSAAGEDRGDELG